MSARTAPHDHHVAFYDYDTELVDAVTRFVGEGLASDEAAIIIATPEHRNAIDTELIARGVDRDALERSGRFISIDARRALASFMSGDAPDPQRFREAIGGVVAGAVKDRPVRAFGEMVALLWDDGNVAAAIALEELWNDLGAEHQFVLFCAYPLRSMLDGDLEAVNHVCATHSQVSSPSSYADGTHDADATAEEVSRIFVPVIPAVMAARTLVEATLIAWNETELLSDALLAMSELASNVVSHARSAFRATIARGRGFVRLSVQDLDHSAPVSPEREIGTIGGLGLVLIEAVASKWGTEHLPEGKRVWCEFAR